MRKINMENYAVRAMTPEGIREVPYDVRMSMENVVLATGEMTSQRLSMSELLRAHRVTQKLDHVNDGHVLLEEEDYQLIKRSFEAFRGFGANEVEMCRRIEEAEKVEVEEKKTKKAP